MVRAFSLCARVRSSVSVVCHCLVAAVSGLAGASAWAEESTPTEVSPGVSAAEEEVLPAPFVRVRRILIDPGHGAHDGGGLGVAQRPEKELALTTSLALRDALLREDPTLEVRLTRESDAYPELSERAHLAATWEADVLLSVHYNWAPNPLALGIETFHLAPEGTTPGELVPGQEAWGEALPVAGEGPTGVAVEAVLADVRRTAATHLSRRLAMALQEALIAETGAYDRGVRQAQFRVLRGVTVPAVVLELGFLSHAEEGKRVFEAEAVASRVAGVVAGLRAWDAWVALGDP